MYTDCEEEGKEKPLRDRLSLIYFGVRVGLMYSRLPSSSYVAENDLDFLPIFLFLSTEN